MIAAAARLQRRRRCCLIGRTQVSKRTTVQALRDVFRQECSLSNSSIQGEDGTTSSFQRPCRRLSSLSQLPFVNHSLARTSIQSRYYYHTCRQAHFSLHSQQRRFYGYGNGSQNTNNRQGQIPGSSTLSPSQIIQYLQSQNVDMSHYRQTDTHVILRECPFCPKPTRGKADNMYKCYIHGEQGFYHCHRCGSGGSWYGLKKRLGGFDVESVAQVARQEGQRMAGPQAVSRTMSTLAAQGDGASWHKNFSVSTAASAAPNLATYSATRRNQRTTTQRGYEDYLRPPPSHPQYGRTAAPLPMPAARLQALYSTQLLDAEVPGPVLKYLRETRGLSIKTLRKYGVGQASYRFPTDDNKWKTADCVTFPWIMSVAQVERQEIARGSHFQWTEDGPKKAAAETATTTEKGDAKKEKEAKPTVQVKETTFITRRIKARAIENKAWQRLDPPGGGWGLFGWHTVPPDATEIVITEGEYDAMAVYQATGRPAVSLPNGCRSLPVEVLPLLENMERIYLWMDTDAAGQEGADNFSKKLGMERTFIVRPTSSNVMRKTDNVLSSTDTIKVPKDANEALLDGLDMERIIENSRLIPHERIMTFHDLRGEVLHEILYPDKYTGTVLESLPGLMKLMQGFRRGELTVLTGPTGSGKTTFLGQVSLDLAEQGTNVLWGSFEIKNTRLLHKLLQQFAREPLPKGNIELEDKMNAIADRFDQLPMYFLTFHGGSDVDQVLEAMDYAVYVNDVEHIILDNMQFMVSRKDMNRSFDKFDVQDVAIEKFRQFATERNVHVTLVVHPRKEAENERLSLASIYGSAKATQEADTVLILQTSGPNNKWIEVKKNRFNGELGRCDLHFDRQSCRYTNTPLGPGAGGEEAPPPSSRPRSRTASPPNAAAVAPVPVALAASAAPTAAATTSKKKAAASNYWDETFGSQ